MADLNDQIKELEMRLDRLVRTQIGFQAEITAIRAELKILGQQGPSKAYDDPEVFRGSEPPPIVPQPPPKWPEPDSFTARPVNTEPKEPRVRSEWERFVGENLLSIIGIVVLVIGVAIGAKFAMDKGWVTPLMRIVAGYVVGTILAGLAIKLKSRFLNFSAFLMAGGIAIMYFITFFAYSLYGLIGQPAAFVLMILMTVFGFAAAVAYSRVVIAHLGLVGAYAIPFLLSTGSKNVYGLFGYMAIVNVGILAISVLKYWRSTFYTSFVATWTIFLIWFIADFDPEHHGIAGLAFAFVFFAIFYVTFLVYKITRREYLAVENIILTLANASIFFCLGYSILDSSGYGSSTGMFAVANAAFHLAAGLVVSRISSATPDVVYLLAALVVIFAAAAVPIQFDGSVVTVLWAIQAAMLFAIGRMKRLPVFEYLAYPMYGLAMMSLCLEWSWIFHNRAEAPFANSVFIAGLFVFAALAVYSYLNDVYAENSPLSKTLTMTFRSIAMFAASAVLFNVLRTEIANFWLWTGDGDDFQGTLVNIKSIVSQAAFAMIYTAGFGFANLMRWKDENFGMAACGFGVLNSLIFVAIGPVLLQEGTETALAAGSSLLSLLAVRYAALVCLALLIAMLFEYARRGKPTLSAFETFAAFIGLCVATSELTHWMLIFGIGDSFKLAVSVLWGIYALILAIFGIFGRRGHLRISAIVLFAVTLLKVFFYDIAHLDTLSKTVVFISLGTLILIVAFLYNKYSSTIFDNAVSETEDL